MNPAQYLRRKDAGEYLKATFGFGSEKTLAKLACISSAGPVFRKVGRTVLYTKLDLDAWARAQIGGPKRSTSDVGPGAV